MRTIPSTPPLVLVFRPNPNEADIPAPAPATSSSGHVNSTGLVIKVKWEQQQTGYWCAPTATRIALTSWQQKPPSQHTLATKMGTTTDGTNDITAVTRVLNQEVPGNPYSSRSFSAGTSTRKKAETLWKDVVHTVGGNRAMVVNIHATPDNHPKGYPAQDIWHYFTVIGWENGSTRYVWIADPANFGGHKEYKLSLNQLASLLHAGDGKHYYATM